AIDRPDLAENPDYATNPLRVKNREPLEALLAEIFLTRSSAHWCERLARYGIPCTPMRTLDEVFASPQAAAREMFPVIDGFRVTGAPVKLSSTPGRVRRRAPKLGEHTREALAELL